MRCISSFRVHTSLYLAISKRFIHKPIHSPAQTKFYQVYENGDRKEYTINNDSTSSSNNEKVKACMKPSNKDHATHTGRWKLYQYAHHSLQQLLPYGYPSSINTGYARFATCQFIASTLGTVCGVLSMQSLFHAVGVGSSSTLPFAAALNWIIKDGLGQLGGVLFASAVNSKFDADPKRWRYIAAFSLDFSCFIELLTPLAPAYFLLIASVANVGKNISYLAASASRAAIHKSFAIHENLADVTAKTGSQTILASLIGTSIGISSASIIGGDFISNIILFCGCSLSGLAATYFSLNRVIINTLTVSKLDQLFQSYLDTSLTLSPRQLMEKEVLLGAPSSNLARLFIGSDLHDAVPVINDVQMLMKIFEKEKYVLNVRTDMTPSIYANDRYAAVHLLLKADAALDDIIFGLFHAYIARRLLVKEGYTSSKSIMIFTKHKAEAAMVSNFAIIEQSMKILHGVECTAAMELGVNESRNFSRSLAASKEWSIEEMHLETRKARIHMMM